MVGTALQLCVWRVPAGGARLCPPYGSSQYSIVKQPKLHGPLFFAGRGGSPVVLVFPSPDRGEWRAERRVVRISPDGPMARAGPDRRAPTHQRMRPRLSARHAAAFTAVGPLPGSLSAPWGATRVPPGDGACVSHARGHRIPLPPFWTPPEGTPRWNGTRLTYGESHPRSSGPDHFLRAPHTLGGACDMR